MSKYRTGDRLRDKIFVHLRCGRSEGCPDFFGDVYIEGPRMFTEVCKGRAMATYYRRDLMLP